MAASVLKLDDFKLETEFGEGYVKNSTYEWDYSTKRPTGVKTWTRGRLIGSGAFGRVYLEEERKGGQLRAVKIIQRHMMETELSRELAALITLSGYSHLFVQFLGWYENDRDIFLAMEYIENGDLNKYMKDHQKKAKSNAAEITKQILEGLQIVHEKGICHRDLKPQNILVASLDPIWVKIADFGTAKQSKNTTLRTQCGTYGYIAPELLGLFRQAGGGFSYALEIWSLGCVVYEILTSKRPFCEADDDGLRNDDMTGLETSFDDFEPEMDIKLLLQYCEGNAEFPAEILRNSQVSEEGIDLVKSLLTADPKSRATASSAIQSLI